MRGGSRGWEAEEAVGEEVKEEEAAAVKVSESPIRAAGSKGME